MVLDQVLQVPENIHYTINHEQGDEHDNGEEDSLLDDCELRKHCCSFKVGGLIISGVISAKKNIPSKTEMPCTVVCTQHSCFQEPFWANALLGFQNEAHRFGSDDVQSLVA